MRCTIHYIFLLLKKSKRKKYIVYYFQHVNVTDTKTVSLITLLCSSWVYIGLALLLKAQYYKHWDVLISLFNWIRKIRKLYEKKCFFIASSEHKENKKNHSWHKSESETQFWIDVQGSVLILLKIDQIFTSHLSLYLFSCFTLLENF